MDDQPLDLRQQKLIRSTKILIVLAIIFSIQGLIVLLLSNYIFYTRHIPFFSFWLNIVLIPYGVFILLIIFKKSERFLKHIAFFLFIYIFLALCDDGFSLYLDSYAWYSVLGSIPFFIPDILLLFLYLKLIGKRSKTRLSKILFAIWIVSYILAILIPLADEENTKYIFSYLWATITAILPPFVFSWVAYMSIANEGFYNYFIEARYHKKLPTN